MELQESEEMDEVLMDSLDEMYLTPSSCHKLSDSHQPPRSPSSVSEEHVVYFTLDVDNCHDNGDNNEEESWDSSSLHRELHEEKERDLLPDERYFSFSGRSDSSDSPELLRTSVLPSDETKVSFALDEAKLNVDACIEVKNHPKPKGDDLEGSAVKTPGFEVHVLTDATSVLTEKIIKRKLFLSKWIRACRFPGFQASEMDLGAPPGMKNSPKLEDNTSDGFFTNKHGCHVIDHIDDCSAQRADWVGERGGPKDFVSPEAHMQLPGPCFLSSHQFPSPYGLKELRTLVQCKVQAGLVQRSYLVRCGSVKGAC